MKYFLHDSNAFNDEKITELFMNFGYEGLGLFYTFLEKIAQQEKPIKTSVLKVQLKVGKRLEKCWNFMEQIGIVCSSNGDSFNKQLLNFSEKYQIKKENNRKRIANWREKQQDVTHYESVSNTPKVKESKVNRSKVNITKDLQPAVADEVNQIMDLFYKVNPTINYGNTTQRKAIEFVLAKWGLEACKSMVEKALAIQGQPYAPVITTPIHFKDKIAQVKIFLEKQNPNKGINILQV